jgi:DNA invertase Pin-like site-specific DNA recombinase
MTITNSAKRVGIYLRVSLTTQTTMNQLLELQKVAGQRGWQVVEVYEDHGISGAKGRESRPAFDKLYKDSARGKFDVVMAWSIDRISRSLHHAVTFMGELGELGVDLYLHQQAVDTSTPSGRALLAMCSVFSELERGLIVERVHAGLRRARAQGKRLGRPPVPREIESAIHQARARGLGIRKLAREVGVGVGTVQRVLSAAGPATP